MPKLFEMYWNTQGQLPTQEKVKNENKESSVEWLNFKEAVKQSITNRFRSIK